MGDPNRSSVNFDDAVQQLHNTGQTFARSAAAARTGRYNDISELLDPRKLNRALFPQGMREACFLPGFNDLTPIIISIDGTASMDQVPFVIQKELPKLLSLLTEQGLTDRPNILFMCHDDELAIPPDATFQMSQFEIGDEQLVKALNELIIPHCGGGNEGEAYHLPIYAAANHVRTDSFDKNGTKGFFFLIGDEEPYYLAGDPAQHGTNPAIAKEVFGDVIEHEISMLQSMKKLCEQYHVFIIRPGHTQNGQNKQITKLWQDLLRQAGENPEHVLFIEDTDAIISTMAMTIGRLGGVDQDELVDVLGKKGASGVNSAAKATMALVPVANAALATTGKASGTLVAAGDEGEGRKRN